MEKGIVISNKPITLSSGLKTYYYYNLKRVMLDPTGAGLLGDLLLEKVREFGAKSVGGLEVAAIPLSTAIIMKAYGKSEIIQSFIVRKNIKKYGLQSQVEGDLVKPIVVVDDVITKGESVKKAVDIIFHEGYKVAGVVCVVDREEENVLRNTVKYESLFTHSDFKSYIDKQIGEKKKNEREIYD
jgi:orotate phosphoribosyltransferase